MNIADADKLKKHFDTVVDVKLFTVPTIQTIINTFSCDIPEGDLLVFRKEGENIIITNLSEQQRQREIFETHFTRKELESWLYEIAMNNIDNSLSEDCEEIISRLDGFERFVKDKRIGGAEP